MAYCHTGGEDVKNHDRCVHSCMASVMQEGALLENSGEFQNNDSI